MAESDPAAAAALAALLALGVDPMLATALVNQWQAAKQLRRVHLFGLTLARDKAILLKEKVAETHKLVSDDLLSAEAGLSTLLSYGISKEYAEPLIIAWTAKKPARHK